MRNRLIITILSVCCVVGSLQAVNLDPLHSLIFLPKPGSTIPVSQPIIAGIMVNQNSKPLKDKPVTVYVDGQKVGTVKTNKNGVWSYTLRATQTLSDGCHCAQAYVMLAESNRAWSQAANFTVHTNCIRYKSGNVSAANSAIVFPFEGSYINTTTPIVVGCLLDSEFSPVSGQTVTVKIDNATIGSPTSDNNGIFSYMASSLSDATHMADAHCVQSSVDLATVNFTIDTVAPSAPTITAPAENETVDTSLVTVGGTTEPDAIVTTFMDGDTYGDISYADGSGTWSFEYELDNGAHSVTAQATDLAGNISSLSSERNFTVDV